MNETAAPPFIENIDSAFDWTEAVPEAWEQLDWSQIRQVIVPVIQDEEWTRRLRQQQAERSRYEAELACRRYLRVDPDNRLAADSLDADWNARLKMLAEAQELCERQREQDRKLVNDQQQAAILSLAGSFPQLCRDHGTPDRERKRIVRLSLEDVTLIRGDGTTLHLRFKGGAHHTIQLPLPLRWWEQRQTGKEAVAEIDRLLDIHTCLEIAAKLNRCGITSGVGNPFTARIVAGIQRRYGRGGAFGKRAA